MPRVCTVCVHADRDAIERCLVAGESSNRALAALYGVSEAALRRHKAAHLPAKLARAQDAAEVARADDLLTQVRGLQAKAMGLLAQAEGAGDYRTALSGIGQVRACLELQAKLLGELDERPQVNVLLMPEWLAVRAALLAALRPYGEARQAVAVALLRMEGHGE